MKETKTLWGVARDNEFPICLQETKVDAVALLDKVFNELVEVEIKIINRSKKQCCHCTCCHE